jgi:lipopolysaccharide transport system permease protein
MESDSGNNRVEAVYSSESPLRRPGQLLRHMFKDISESRELALRLFLRNIRSKYRQTMFGYVWAFLPPVVTTLVFVFLNSQKIINVGDTDIPYPAYVLIGTLLWQGFVDALNSPLRAMSESKSFLVKINFPREALVLAGVGEVLFNFTIRLVLFFAVFLWYRLSLPLSILLAPVGILALIALGLMFGLLLAPLGMLYQDLEKALPLITTVWLLLTPVVYPPLTNWPASLLSSLNPVSPLLVTTREMLTQGSFSQLTGFMVVGFTTCILLLLVWILCRLALPHLIERMGA